MSSKAVRDKIRVFLSDELSSEKIAEIDGDFEDLKEFLANQINTVTSVATPITMVEPWLGLQYIGDQEQVVSVNANNSSGRYRESGSITLHVVDKAKVGANRTILTRCDTIVEKFRGRNIDGVRINGIVPANFSRGATLDFVGGGYVSATVTLLYEYDRDL